MKLAATLPPCSVPCCTGLVRLSGLGSTHGCHISHFGKFEE